MLLAADYRMKRLAMDFELSPVRGLTSFLQMYKSTGRGMDNMLPRWWLEPKYESVLRSPDGLAWEFNGASVKCMTEEDFATANGQREHLGKPNAVAQKWADNMTAHYDELCVAAPVFGELRNCMQLAMVGALVAHERMADKAGCTLPSLMQESVLKFASSTAAPTQVDSHISMFQKGTNWIISASGGVNISPARSPARPARVPLPPKPAQGPQRRKRCLVLELTFTASWHSANRDTAAKRCIPHRWDCLSNWASSGETCPETSSRASWSQQSLSPSRKLPGTVVRRRQVGLGLDRLPRHCLAAARSPFWRFAFPRNASK